MHDDNAGKRVDWDRFRHSLERAEASIRANHAPSAAMRDSILHERGRQLARTYDAPETGEIRNVVSFRLGSESYGIALEFIEELHHLKEYAPLPASPSFLLGIANIRGRIVSLLNLKVFLALPFEGLTPLDKVIVLKHGRRELGVLVDEVDGIRQVEWGALRDMPPSIDLARSELALGITAGDVTILRAERILEDSRINGL